MSRSVIQTSRAKRYGVRIAALGAIVYGVGIGSVMTGSAQQPELESEADVQDASRELIVGAARRYELFLGPDRRRLQMQKEPALLWPNPTREVPAGATFIWTLDGRPEAIGCIWRHDVLCHAFQSLSTRPLVAEYGGKAVWRPAEAGVTLRQLPNAPEPATSVKGRLSQMKGLARRFRCRLSDDTGSGDELRLLPQPLYRYETNAEQILDGALFAFVQGTDPEVILMVEAHRGEAKSEWRYAITRRSMLALEAELDGEKVWTVRWGPGAADEAWFQGGIAAAE